MDGSRPVGKTKVIRIYENTMRICTPSNPVGPTRRYEIPLLHKNENPFMKSFAVFAGVTAAFLMVQIGSAQSVPVREPIVIDGKFDDKFWLRHKDWSVASLRELQTGEQPVFGTSVMAAWDKGGQNLYFAIRCEERPGENLNITSTKHDDQALWYGDAVEILLDTDSHTYYQIAVNPAGALVDLDRGASKNGWFRWESQAEVATHVADDHWNIEIRIPVTEDENDPLNFVIGRKPSQSLPWHFNICRQRSRENGTELSALAPTGTKAFHVPLKFAHFYDGHSHSFEVDETITDFLIEYTAAAYAKRKRKYAEALSQFVGLADYDGASDYQKSKALAEASACAQLAGDGDKAMELASQIPLESIAKIAEIETLAHQKNWDSILEQFGDEDLSKWPFTEVGAAAAIRGKSFHAAKTGLKADKDFQLALEYTSDARAHMSILSAMARNRETVLEDDNLALETFRRIAASNTNIGSAEYYSGLQDAARILTKQGKFDEAMNILKQVDAGKLGGSWAPSMLYSQAETLAAAGRNKEALDAYRSVVDHKSVAHKHKERAEQAIAELSGK